MSQCKKSSCGTRQSRRKRKSILKSHKSIIGSSRSNTAKYLHENKEKQLNRKVKSILLGSNLKPQKPNAKLTRPNTQLEHAKASRIIEEHPSEEIGYDSSKFETSMDDDDLKTPKNIELKVPNNFIKPMIDFKDTRNLDDASMNKPSVSSVKSEKKLPDIINLKQKSFRLK